MQVPWPPPVTTVAVLLLALGASVCDLISRRVPNWLTFGAAAVAIAKARNSCLWAGG